MNNHDVCLVVRLKWLEAYNHLFGYIRWGLNLTYAKIVWAKYNSHCDQLRWEGKCEVNDNVHSWMSMQEKDVQTIPMKRFRKYVLCREKDLEKNLNHSTIWFLSCLFTVESPKISVVFIDSLFHTGSSPNSLGDDKVSMLTHTYPHKPQGRNKVTICNHQADSPLYVA